MPLSASVRLAPHSRDTMRQFALAQSALETRMVQLLILALALAACEGRSNPALGASEAGRQVSQDTPDVQAARRALAEGRPWRASELLQPALRDSARRTPAVVLLAAQAAAAWEGWDEAHRLLASEPWLDSLRRGAGRALLARASLELGHDSVALEHARLAVGSAAAPSEQGRRTVILARALDRQKMDDSARASYERAAGALPAIADWLLLRAAGVTPDSARRFAYFARMRSTPSRARISWTDAQARERSRDFAGAARVYAGLGAQATSLRLRLTASPDSAEQAALRRQLLQLVADGRSSQEARTATEVLDLFFSPLTAAEELVVARRAAESGPLARAQAGFERAFNARIGTDADRFAFASILSRLGRDADAATQFARIRARPLAGQASYFRARSLLRSGRGDAARTALARTAATHPRDTVAASLALYLLGDLATDDQQDAEARKRFLDLVRRYPTSAQATTAAFRAALVAFIDGDFRTAARELDALAARPGRTNEALAALYWSGRAWSGARDTARAQERWREVMSRDPLSYYAMVAAQRLGANAWAPPPAADSFPRNSAVDSAIARIALLQEVGMATEARLEYDQLVKDAGSDPERLIATAATLREAGEVGRSAQLVRHIFAGSTPRDASIYRLLYPLTSASAVRAEAERNRVEFALIAALIKQESGFNPRAVSPAGAVGMMQLMPDVARQLAQSQKFPIWDRALLFQPDVNVQLGAIHFAGLLRRYDHVEYALAAYNAGGSRVARWLTKPGAADPEIFVERIPFVETRDYVRIVLRNRALYRALYPSAAPAGPLPD